VAADQERLALANEAVMMADGTRSEVARAVSRARNPETDLHAADIALADAELDREHAGHELASARLTLASSWGAFDADFPAVSFALRNLREPEPFETLAAKLPDAVLLRAAMLEEGMLAATVRVAESQARPDLALNLGVRRLEAFADHGLVMSVSMPLGSPGRGRLALAEARAGQSAQAHSRAALQADLHQLLFEKYQELVHARTEIRALDDALLPKARAALALAQRGFDAGRFAFSVLSQAQRTLFDLRRREIDAAARYHALSADIQQITSPGAP
jgi:cobalt-zinc-cadmium efflux system outer membrane protein